MTPAEPSVPLSGLFSHPASRPSAVVASPTPPTHSFQHPADASAVDRSNTSRKFRHGPPKEKGVEKAGAR